MSRDVTFSEDSFLKDDKVDFQNDRKGKGKAVEMEQQVQDAAMDNPMDVTADQHTGSADFPMPMDQQGADPDSPTLDRFQQSGSDDPSSSERFQPSSSAGPSGSDCSPSVGRYNVARDRKMREVRPPIRYGYFDLVSYAL